MEANSRIVRVEVREDGLWLKVWVDDDDRGHLAIGLVCIPHQMLSDWYQEVENVRELARQGYFSFDA